MNYNVCRWYTGAVTKIAPLFVLALLMPFATDAHGMGASFERDVGEYRIDVGYDPAQVRAGDRILFDFGTLWKNGELFTDFDHVWVRIEFEGKTVLATGVKRAAFGPTSLLYVIPADYEGEIILDVRYEGPDGTLADTEFTLLVTAAPFSLRDIVPAIALLVGIVPGGFAVYVFMKRRSRLVY